MSRRNCARPEENPLRHSRVLAAVDEARVRRLPIRLPSTVLIELLRGRGFDEPVNRLLARGAFEVVSVGPKIARITGHLLAVLGEDSELAIDATVVATAVRFGGGNIVTHDPEDLRRLASDHANIGIIAI